MANLVNNLPVRVTREVFWRLDDGSELRVPAGTVGRVKINGREVGYWFDGMRHPKFGMFPTIAYPGSVLENWLEVVEKESR